MCEVICPCKDNCTEYKKLCYCCKKNIGKRSYYEPDQPCYPYYPYPYYPWWPNTGYPTWQHWQVITSGETSHMEPITSSPTVGTTAIGNYYQVI